MRLTEKRVNFMTRSFNKTFILLSFIFLQYSSLNLKAQDIYDHEHSWKFANYLLQSQQYDFAAEEFERLLFMKPESDTLKYLILKSYRLGGKLNEGIKKTHFLYNDVSEMPDAPGKEYLRMLIMDQNIQQSQYFISQNENLAESEKHKMRLNIELLQNNYDSAAVILQRHEDAFTGNQKEKYNMLITQGKNLPHKSAGLATVMSTVVPGAGKIYTGDWKDGIISFVMVGVLSYQAYNGFINEGTGNAVPWIYAGLGAGFYFGNIFGSYKSAKDYNQKALHQYEHQVQNYIYSSF